MAWQVKFKREASSSDHIEARMSARSERGSSGALLRQAEILHAVGSLPNTEIKQWYSASINWSPNKDLSDA